MLLPKEPLGDRLRRRMVERKDALMAATAKRPKPPEQDYEALDAKTPKAELVAIDRHAAKLRKQLGRKNPQRQALGYGSDTGTYKHQEIETELHQLAILRAELKADSKKPITHDREGKPVGNRLRAMRRFRTQEIAESKWCAAERAESEGDHQRARQLRHDALRARHLAEYEMRLRPSLRGYSYPG